MIRVSMLAEQFRNALNLASPAVQRKAIMPVLSSYLVEAEREEVRVSAMDLTLGVRVTIGASVENHGREVYNGETLAKWVSAIGTGEMHIRTKSQDEKSPTVFSAGSSRLTMNHLDANDFPVLPDWEECIPLATVDAEDLVHLLQTAAISAVGEVNTGRPVLECVELVIAPGSIAASGADGYRMSYMERPGSHQVKGSLRLNIPRRSVLAFVRLIESQQPATVDLRLTSQGTRVMARFGPVEWVSGLVEGVYPGVRALIPRPTLDTHHLIRFHAESMLRALAPIVGIARTQDKVYIDFSNAGDDLTPGRVLLSASAQERGDGEGGIDAIVTHGKPEDTVFAISCGFLSDVLSDLKDREVELSVSGKSTPVLFRAAALPEAQQHAHVVVPMIEV